MDSMARMLASAMAVATAAALTSAVPLHARATEPVDVAAPRPPAPTRHLLIAGGVTGGLGVIAATIGFSTWGGMHAANPGPGLQLDGTADSSHRALRLARGMEALAYTGVALTVVGTIVLAVGVDRLRKHRRAHEMASRPRLVPGSGGLALRF